MKRALLFSGGLSPRQDKPRYKNNLLAFSRLLTQQFSYESDQIRVCLSDGAHSEFPTKALPATKANLLAQLSWLAQATEQDTIFFLASNHGDEEGLCLWKEQSVLSPKELEDALSSCLATKIFIFGQCYSGIFGQMKLSRAVICCACGDAEESMPVPFRKPETPRYDEFIYQMAGALAGEYPDQRPIEASKAAATIYEAHEYATRIDRTMKTPLFFPDQQEWAKTVTL